VLITILILSGCGAQETMETISDEQAAPVMAQMREISLVLPEEAASPAVESDSERLYLCEDYEITVQILDGGNLDETVKTLSGYDRDVLTVLTTRKDNLDRHEFVWACAGEEGELVGRAMVLDDGSYHYCVAILGDAQQAMENKVLWDDMFQSFTLA
jgi:hypothetical protein